MPTSAPENPPHLRRRYAPSQFQIRSERKLLQFFLKCVIMVIVFSTFLFFLGFAAVVLLHFLFMSNTFHRCNSRSTNPGAEPLSALPHTAALLPKVSYTASAFSRFSTDCAICLDSFKEGDECRYLPACKHLFHAKCVDRWIGRKPSCPVCRTRVDIGSGFQDSSINGDDLWKNLRSFGFERATSQYQF